MCHCCHLLLQCCCTDTVFSLWINIFRIFLFSIVVSLPADRLQLMNRVRRLLCCCHLTCQRQFPVQFSYSLCTKEVLISIFGCLNLRLVLLYILSAAKNNTKNKTGCIRVDNLPQRQAQTSNLLNHIIVFGQQRVSLFRVSSTKKHV